MNKRYYVLIAAIILMIMALGTSYAFFTYDKTSTKSHSILMGDIELHYNEETDTVALTNAFPMTKEQARSRNDNFITFTIAGTNQSNKDINYEIDLIHGENVSGKNRIDDKLLVFDLQENDEYVVNGGSFQELQDYVSIWVNKVPASTNSNITKTYKLRMWISDGIIISDSEANANYTTSEYKNLFATIKVRVLGDFAEHDYNHNLYQIIRSKAVPDNIPSTYVFGENGIDFNLRNESNNGKGVYLRHGTEGDNNPIYYYRGEVKDNNVEFGGFCWKIVRTTETGGIKLLYNGETGIHQKTPINNSDYTVTENEGYTFNNSTKEWEISFTDYAYKSISFTVPSGNYSLMVSIISPSSDGYADYSLSVGGSYYRSESLYDDQEFQISVTSITSTIAIHIYFDGMGTQDEPTIAKFKMATRGSLISNHGCEATYDEVIIGDEISFNENPVGYEVFGYMYGDLYPISFTLASSSHYFGTGFTYSNGVYTLTDPKLGIDANHHYTCKSTDPAETCQTITYYGDSTNLPHFRHAESIELKNGESIFDALEKIREGKHDSTIKTYIDNWYRDNLTSYTSRLENAIYCNNRRVVDNNGWMPTGGEYLDSLTFRAYESYENGNIVPDLTCEKIDSFSLPGNSNGNGKLKYPIGLLTADEALLSEGVVNEFSRNFVTATPAIYHDDDGPKFFTANIDIESFYSNNVRPAITLRGSTILVGGSGTREDPYIVD